MSFDRGGYGAGTSVSADSQHSLSSSMLHQNVSSIHSPSTPQNQGGRTTADSSAVARQSTKSQVNDTEPVKMDGHVQEDLWGSILNSVKSSRAVPVKNLIILGEPRTGKSTLLAQLAASSPAAYLSHHLSDDTSYGESSGLANGETTADMAIGYSYFDVGDDDGEDVVARVGVFQVSSSDPSHLSLLPIALKNTTDTTANSGTRLEGRSDPPGAGNGEVHQETRLNAKPAIEALRESMFLITLDWEAPWTFLSQLLEWLDVIREVVESAGGAGRSRRSPDQTILEEMRQSLEATVRAYADPAGPAPTVEDEEDTGNTSVASAIVPVSNPIANDGDAETLPLPEGCLTHNFGVPLIIVCTKADTIIQLERDRSFKEEKFDYIQQVLRTISLKYGAGLFFTAQSKPESFQLLRSYILHRLFSSAHESGTGRPFAFPHRASTVERDVLLVPTGWDSFGKIRALRDAFDCAGMANGWEWDCQVERIRRREKLAKGSRQAEELAEREIDRRTLPGLVEGDRSGIESTVKLYEAIVEDWDANGEPSANQTNNLIKRPDDQSFLLQHYNTLQRDPDAKRKPAPQNSTAPQVQLQGVPGARSVVGPLGSSSLSLPSVERVMQEKLTGDEGKKHPSSRREGQATRERDRDREREGGRSTPVHRSVATSAVQSPPLSSSDKTGGSRPTSPPNSAQAGLQTPKQSEVLHSFFQSLLKEKGPSGGSTRSSASRAHAEDRERGHR